MWQWNSVQTENLILYLINQIFLIHTQMITLFWNLTTVCTLQAVWWTTQRSLRQNFARSQVVKLFLNLSDGNLLFQLNVKQNEIMKSFRLRVLRRVISKLTTHGNLQLVYETCQTRWCYTIGFQQAGPSLKRPLIRQTDRQLHTQTHTSPRHRKYTSDLIRKFIKCWMDILNLFSLNVLFIFW